MNKKLGITTSKGFHKTGWVELVSNIDISPNSVISTDLKLDEGRKYIFKVETYEKVSTFVLCVGANNIRSESNCVNYNFSDGEEPFFGVQYLSYYPNSTTLRMNTNLFNGDEATKVSVVTVSYAEIC